MVKEEGAREWRLTGMYGEPNRALRRRTWSLIRRLHEQSELPWCLIGDLNNVLNECGLIDLDLNGYQFTWEMGFGTNRWVEVRIDRALSSHSWLHMFPMAELFNLEFSTSDHSPLLLDPIFTQSSPQEKKFRFENAWLREPVCQQIVSDIWDSCIDRDILGKLAHYGQVLGSWGKEVTGNFNHRIHLCKKKLSRLKGRRDVGAVQRYKEEQQKLYEALTQKEIFWRKRSKQLWLKEGDPNTKFFHA
ncbi:uncharacterized protein LOC133824468 [Humulus lupulus]|uniref:uncharacterized protein LOC133824468 n=1 Tax=Humulus lupulus TaxID=3486 RepID=UPI002B40D1EC|nr:uncharacterized protein LOC133824468 [Humulus lupulus]